METCLAWGLWGTLVPVLQVLAGVMLRDAARHLAGRLSGGSNGKS